MSIHPISRRSAVVGAVAGGFLLTSCHSSTTSTTAPYPQVVSAFYSSVAALDAGDTEHAPIYLAQAVKLAPGEPAVWANLALNDMRLSQIDQAAKDLKKAQDLAPDNPDIMALAGDLAVDKGDYAGAIAEFNRAIAKDPNNLKTRYALYQAIQQQGGADVEQKGEDQLKQMLQVQPNNVAVMLELAAAAAKNGDSAVLKQVLSTAQTQSTAWSGDARDQLKSAITAASNPRAAVPDVMRLRNELETDPSYQQALGQIQVSEGTVADPIDHFLTLPSPSPSPAPADTGLTFSPEPVSTPGKPSVVRSVWFSGSGKPAIVSADAKQVTIDNGGQTSTLPFPGGGTSANASSILPVDLDDDGLVDLVTAGAGGVKIYHQAAGGKFTDVTASTKLPSTVTSGKWTGAWAANVYTGGAIDIVLGSATGAPTVLRNNDNGTLTVIHPFVGVDGVRAFEWVDLDGDGVGDAALIDGAGRLRVFHNERAGSFKEWPTTNLSATALSAVDLHRDGRFELVIAKQDGTISELSFANGTASEKPLGISCSIPGDGSGRLIWADLDNNGALDLIATSSTGTQIWLGDDKGGLVPLASKVDGRSVSIEDDGVSGRLGLVGLAADGTSMLFKNQGTKNYHWQQIHLQAVSKGDGKNNSFGVGGTISIRAGLLYEDQPITGPVTHFGLGTNPNADYARIDWPNGNPQAEFGLKPDQLVATSERLKGSCPWLFAWNGKSFVFLKDFLWRSALGLRIDAQDTTGGGMTGDWNKIAGDQLVPKDGSYDLRLDTQLWESYFFDKLQLMTVDHPVGTEMWVDERFCIPPPALAYHITTPAKPVAHAVDDRGNDVTDLLTAVDGRYVDSFGLGRYQGVTRDHWLQVDLGPAPSRPGKEWLLAEGWIHPTDSSINMQLSLGDHPKPTGLSLEVPDGHGGWRTARTGIGFPEGKNKTILIDVSGLFKPGEDRQVRLRTNLELYWDWMATATEIPGAKVVTHVLDPSTADLRYHGFNHIDRGTLTPSPSPNPARSSLGRGEQEDPSQPEIPDYGRLASVGQQWRDMEGFYTRYGDVRELLKTVDDRYVIMNAGDEIALKFPEQPAPSTGMVRDFVMIGDGWGKDCDINSGFSKTVLPLPSHADLKYNRPAGRLEDDPVYKAHRADWETYQTRYVSPRSFETDLVR